MHKTKTVRECYTVGERVVWNQKRSDLSFALFELLPKLELYLTFTNDDVGIVRDDNATLNNSFMTLKNIHQSQV